MKKKKVDNHLHLAAAFSAQMLNKFISEKFKNHRDDVIDNNGKRLADIENELKMTFGNMTTDSFNLHVRRKNLLLLLLLF